MAPPRLMVSLRVSRFPLLLLLLSLATLRQAAGSTCAAGKHQESSGACAPCAAGRYGTATSSGIAGCPAGFSLSTSNNICYKVLTKAANWDTQKAACESQGPGTHLASVPSREDQNFIENTLLTANTGGYWIGINDKNKEDQYQTATGGSVSFTDWAPSPYKQPDNGFGQNEEDCVEIMSGSSWRFKWNDGKCSNQDKAICSCPPGVMTTASCEQCGAGNYQSQVGKTACTTCQKGHFSATVYKRCETWCAGHRGPDGEASSWELRCSWSSQACSGCQQCATLTSHNSVDCTDCPKGRYQDQRGQQRCEDCDAGTFMASPGAANACTACAAGTFADRQQQEACAPCQAGTYQSKAGKSACILCASGDFQAATGKSACAKCQPGTYQAETGKSVCTACAPGKFSGGAAGCSFIYPNSADSAQQCPTGTEQPNCQKGGGKCPACSASTPVGEWCDLSGGDGGHAIADVDPACSELSGQLPTGSGAHGNCPGSSVAMYRRINPASSCLDCPAGQHGAATGRDCAVGYELSASGNICYRIVDTRRTWDAHKSACEAEGAELARVPSYDDNEFLRGKLQQLYGTNDWAWLGIRLHDGVWETTDFNPLPYTNWDGTHGTQPDNYGGAQDCVTMVLEWNGKWDDGECGDEHHAVCSRPPLTSKSVATCAPCEAGRFAAQAGQRTCSPCGVGTYTNQTGSSSSSACVPCAAGSFANTTGQASCGGCAKGRYQGQAGKASCEACPGGKYLDETGKSAAGACKPCGKGRYSSAQGATVSTQCSACSAGTYGDETGQTATSSCKPCSAGKYNAEAGQTASTACIICAAGRFSDAGAGRSSDAGCWWTDCLDRSEAECRRPGFEWSRERSGAECGGGDDKARCCPLGPGPVACSGCPLGQYGDESGGTTCKSCGPGFYQNVTGEQSCWACGRGRAGASAGSSSSGACESCAVGRFQDETGRGTCKDHACPSGQYASSAPDQPEDCSPSCLAGRAKDPATGACRECASGLYTAFPEQPSCNGTACPAGTWGYSGRTSAAEAAQCFDCVSGRYNTETGQLSCHVSSCVPGQYHASRPNETQACAACQLGRFTAQPGQPGCEDCKVGEYAAETGAVSCTACAAGTFSDQRQQGACAPCQAGAYQAATGKSACTLCASGDFQAATGKSACVACPAGQIPNRPGGAATGCMRKPAPPETVVAPVAPPVPEEPDQEPEVVTVVVEKKDPASVLEVDAATLGASLNTAVVVNAAVSLTEIVTGVDALSSGSLEIGLQHLQDMGLLANLPGVSACSCFAEGVGVFGWANLQLPPPWPAAGNESSSSSQRGRSTRARRLSANSSSSSMSAAAPGVVGDDDNKICLKAPSNQANWTRLESDGIVVASVAGRSFVGSHAAVGPAAEQQQQQPDDVFGASIRDPAGCDMVHRNATGLKALLTQRAFVGTIFWFVLGFVVVSAIHAASIAMRHRCLPGRRTPDLLLFPRIELTVLLACYHGVAYSSMHLLASASTAWISVGMFALLIYPIALAAYVFFQLRFRVRSKAHYATIGDHTDGPAGTGAAAGWTDATDERFVAKYGPLFSAFRRRYYWWRGLSMTFRLLSGAFLANIMQLPGLAPNVCLVVLYVLYAVATGAARPYRRLVSNLTEVVLYLLYAAMVGMPLIAQASNLVGRIDECNSVDRAMTALTTTALVLVVVRGVSRPLRAGCRRMTSSKLLAHSRLRSVMSSRSSRNSSGGAVKPTGSGADDKGPPAAHVAAAAGKRKKKANAKAKGGEGRREASLELVENPLHNGSFTFPAPGGPNNQKKTTQTERGRGRGAGGARREPSLELVENPEHNGSFTFSSDAGIANLRQAMAHRKTDSDASVAFGSSADLSNLVTEHECGQSGRRYTVNPRTGSTEWVDDEHQCPASGRRYLVHRHTGDSRWAEDAHTCDDTGHTYLVHRYSGETRWAAAGKPDTA